MLSPSCPPVERIKQARGQHLEIAQYSNPSSYPRISEMLGSLLVQSLTTGCRSVTQKEELMQRLCILLCERTTAVQTWPQSLDSFHPGCGGWHWQLRAECSAFNTDHCALCWAWQINRLPAQQGHWEGNQHHSSVTLEPLNSDRQWNLSMTRSPFSTFSCSCLKA